MAQVLFKILLIVVLINTFLYTAGVRVIGEDNEAFMGNFVNTSSNSLEASTSLQKTLPTTFSKSGSALLDFIDSLGAIGNFIVFIVNIVFTPFGLLSSSGLPSGVGLLVGLPLVLILILGIAYFIRSGG
jgi:hypothetical protein